MGEGTTLRRRLVPGGDWLRVIAWVGRRVHACCVTARMRQGTIGSRAQRSLQVMERNGEATMEK
jgi:hypothetical protein